MDFKVFEAIEKKGNYIKGKQHNIPFSGHNLTYFNRKGYKSEYNNFDDSHKKFTFTHRGLVKKEIEYYSNGDVQNKSFFKYKRRRDSIEVIRNDSIGGKRTYYIKYDKTKNLIKDGTGLHQYDDNGNKLKQINKHFTINWKYDENGNMIKKNYKGSYTTVKSDFLYTKFDEMGNWIEQIEFRDGKAKFISERTIEYY